MNRQGDLEMMTAAWRKGKTKFGGGGERGRRRRELTDKVRT